MIEAMTRYQKFYGIKAMGPHRTFAHSVLGPLCVVCARCEGSGIVDGDAPKTCRNCAACEGLGMVWTGSLETVKAARAMVAAKYPDGVVATLLPTPTSPFVANSIGTGSMVDLRGVQSEDSTENAKTSQKNEDSMDQFAESDDEEALTLRERRARAVRRRPRRTKAVRAILDADAAKVQRLIAMIKDDELAGALHTLQVKDNSAAADLLIGRGAINDEAQAAFVSGLWSDEDVADAEMHEDGCLWLHCVEVRVTTDDVLYYFFLNDGYVNIGWFGIFADRTAAKTAIALQGSITQELGRFWEGVSTPLDVAAQRKRDVLAVKPSSRVHIIDDQRVAFEKKLPTIEDIELREICTRLLPLIEPSDRDYSRDDDEHYALRDALLAHASDHCGTSFVEGVWSPKAVERAIEREQFCWAQLYAFPVGDGTEIAAIVWSDSAGDGKVGGLFTSRRAAVDELNARGGIDADMIGDWAG